MSILNLILGGVQLIAGIVLTATGLGGGLGLKLILSGALSLISSFMSAKTGRGGISSSPTYGFDNLTNGAREGGPVPVIYGTHRVTPPIIDINLKQEGDQQTLYLLCLIGEGEINTISQVYLNGTTIGSFKGASWDYKRGTASQEAFADFSQIKVGYSATTQLTKGQTHVYDMKVAGDEVDLGFTWTGGLFVQDGNGTKEGISAVKIRYKTFGAADTTYAEFPAPPTSAPQGPWYAGGGTNQWWTGGNSRSAVRRALRLVFDNTASRPPRGRYTIEVTGITDNTATAITVPTLTSIIEVTNTTLTYPNRALLYVKCPAVEQLAGTIPVVTADVGGLKVFDPRAGTTAWSDNPALCVADLLTNTRYGLGAWITTSMLDLSVTGDWQAVANRCDATVTHNGVTEKRWRLNYALDSKAPAVDHLTQMLSCFRATLFAADGYIRISQDTTGSTNRHFEDTAAAAVTTRRNVQHETGREGFGDRSLLTAHALEDSQRWNVVKATYLDADRNYQHRTLTVRNKSVSIGAITGTFTAGEAVKFGTTTKGAFVFQRNGTLYYVQGDADAAVASGVTVTGLSSGATCTTTSSPTNEESPERVLEMNLFGTTTRLQAIREMRYNLNRAVMTPTFAQIPCGLGDLDLLPGDVIDVSSDYPAAWSSKLFTTLAASYGQDGRGVITAREYDAGVFVDTVDSTVIDVPTTTATPTSTSGSATPISSAGAAGGGSGGFGSSSSSGAFFGTLVTFSAKTVA